MTRLQLTLIAGLVLTGCTQPLAIVRGPNKNVDRVVVEVDYTTSSPPPQAFLRALELQMEQVTDGTDVVIILDEALTDEGHSTWSKKDRLYFAWKNKGHADRWYLVYAAGSYAEDPNAGGVSWNTRDMFLFPDRYGGANQLSKQAALHEFCHTLGLVNDELKMQSPHEHPWSSHHCSNPGCLMLPVQNLQGDLPCAACIADLEAGEER